MEKVNGESLNIIEDNIKKLKQVFPEVFEEGKIAIDKLEEILGDYKVNTNTERYNFTWPEKLKAIRISQTPSTGTLRPSKEESKNWDTTQNIYIEGDNLEVLKLLQKPYYGGIKMIYIDPPYNTGNDFVYKDDFKDNLENYLELTGQKDENRNKITTNTEANGRYHSNWLNMMYPRLKLARNLLSVDGVIFISIDDNEVNNLRKICDEIFGEENFIANIVWQKKYSPQNDAKYFSDMHDYIICYAKSRKYSTTDVGWERYLLPRTEEQNKRYKNIDNDTRGLWKAGDFSVKTYSKEYDYPITLPSGKIINPPIGRCWRTSKINFEKLVEDNRIWFGLDGNNVPSIKRFITEVQDGRVPTTWWNRENFADNQKAAQEIKEIFKNSRPFDTPKPTILINNILKLSTRYNDVILDFFSGSSTTAHATMQLNVEDGGNRKFIMVQLPEKCNEKSEAFKAGYKNICEIGKERIRRAGEKIKEDNKDKEVIQNLDIGFKVFKLDSSNINKWDTDSHDTLKDTLLSNVENVKSDRTEEDVLYEILLKYGIDLNMPIEEYEIKGKKVFSIGFGAILVCLDKNITLEVVEAIGKLKEDLEPEFCRVVFMDNGFNSDSIKTNAVQILKRYGIEDVKSI